ncbi:hypothetical protein, partial [Providencia huaxiensis]|uniref:hypothetical protein n=1 Tax=Providencia huaxiensis TaxID=2027290 RepID=UPI002FE14797
MCNPIVRGCGDDQCKAATTRSNGRTRSDGPAASFAGGTVAKLAMRQPFVLFKGLTFQKLCLP